MSAPPLGRSSETLHMFSAALNRAITEQASNLEVAPATGNTVSSRYLDVLLDEYPEHLGDELMRRLMVLSQTIELVKTPRDGGGQTIANVYSYHFVPAATNAIGQMRERLIEVSVSDHPAVASNPSESQEWSLDEPVDLHHNLEDIRRQIDYWASRQGEGEAGSNFEIRVANRIQQLERLESRCLEQSRDSDPSLHEQTVKKFMNWPVVVVVLIVVAVIIGIAAFLDALGFLQQWFSR